MLTQVNHWIEIVGTGVDVLLVLRILQLRLYRTYLFITLACVLGVFFDGVSLWLGKDYALPFIYSRFLYVFVTPAAAFDVWEEMQSQLGRFRRIAVTRLILSLAIAGFAGIIIASFAASDDSVPNQAVSSFAVILWAASLTASLGFLWTMHRLTRAQKMALTNNTFVWLLYSELSLIAEVIVCFYLIASPLFNNSGVEILDLVLGLFSIAITTWCMIRLRASESTTESTPANVNP